MEISKFRVTSRSRQIPDRDSMVNLGNLVGSNVTHDREIVVEL